MSTKTQAVLDQLVIIHEEINNPIHKNKSEAFKAAAARLPGTVWTSLSAMFYADKAEKEGRKYGSNNKDKKLAKKDRQLVLANKSNIQINGTKHRRPGAPVSLALEMAELAVNRLSYDEKLLLAKTILDSEQ